MERLTMKELYDGRICYTKCQYTNCKDRCSDCEIPEEALKKLKEYEDQEENGELLNIPCKIGDVLYVKMQSGGYAEAEVRDYIYFISCGFCVVVTSTKGEFNKQNIPFSEFGRTIFKTQEEAEATLKKE